MAEVGKARKPCAPEGINRIEGKLRKFELKLKKFQRKELLVARLGIIFRQSSRN
jgi:hypothetical protein